MLRSLVGSVVLAWALVASAGFAEEKKVALTIEQLHDGAKGALADFKAGFNVAPYAYQATVVDSKITIYYKKGAQQKTAVYHCHLHGPTEVACHDEHDGHDH